MKRAPPASSRSNPTTGRALPSQLSSPPPSTARPVGREPQLPNPPAQQQLVPKPRRASPSPTRVQTEKRRAAAAESLRNAQPRQKAEAPQAPPVAVAPLNLRSANTARQTASPAKPARASAAGGAASAASVPLKAAQECVNYIDAVGTSLTHRVKSVPDPPESQYSPRGGNVANDGSTSSRSVGGMPLSLQGLASMPSSPTGSSEQVAGERNLLVDVQRAANGVLHWVHVMELRRPPEGVSFEDADRNITMLCQDLSAAVSTLQRELTNPLADKRAADFVRNNSSVFGDCRNSIETLFQFAKSLTVIRSAVQTRDVDRAKQLISEGKQQYATRVGTPRGKNASGSSSGVGASALLVWLERTWVPAMSAWQKIRDDTNRAVSESRSPAEAEAAIDKAQVAAIQSSNTIAEVLLPGESLSALVEREITKPNREAASQRRAKHEAMEKLRDAIDAMDYTALGSCIRSLENFELITEEEKGLKRRANELLVNVQRVAKVTVGLTVAARPGSDDPFPLLHALHDANQVIAAFRIAADAEQCLAALESAEGLLEAVKPGGAEGSIRAALAAAIDVNVVTVPHLPAHAWAPELTEIYQRAAESLAHLVARARLRSELASCLATMPQQPKEATPQSIASLQSLLVRCRESALPEAELELLHRYVQEATEVSLKIHHNSNIRLTGIAGGMSMTFTEARNALAAFCGLERQADIAALRIRYQDVDGDHITVASDEDWQLMLRSAARGEKSGRYEVYCDTPPTMPSATTAVASSSSAVTPPRTTSGAHLGMGKSPAHQQQQRSPAAQAPPVVQTSIPAVFKNKAPKPSTPMTPTGAAGGTPTRLSKDALAVVDLEPSAMQHVHQQQQQSYGNAMAVSPGEGGPSRWEVDSQLELNTVVSEQTTTTQRDLRERWAAGEEGGRRGAKPAGGRPPAGRDPVRASMEGLQQLHRMRSSTQGGASGLRRGNAPLGPPSGSRPSQGGLAVVGRGNTPK